MVCHLLSLPRQSRSPRIWSRRRAPPRPRLLTQHSKCITDAMVMII
ncbi:hypothetical protein BRADI_3g12696v3 [Brachypodium distachyon]|uniref:Uncharacterized protein n=1 Tax=Brachypodium distachyon TaxID=15368 RepID=A0A0Q3PZ50_BRADI|nr:hypothetical protein BRADI_3g12696v3 [Brachypodium distachyon]